MGLWDFLKKDKDEDKKTAEDQSSEQDQDAKGQDRVHHAMDTGEAVPQAVKDVLAKVRGDQDPGYVEVELNDDGSPVNPEHADLLKTGSVVKDDEAASVDGKESEDDSSQESGEPAGDDPSGESKVVVIPSRLVAAGEKMGWDAERIQRIAAADLSILEDLASRQEKDTKHRQDTDGKDGASESTGGQTESPALKKLREKLGDEADEVLRTIAAGVRDDLKTDFDELKADKKARAEEAAIRVSNDRARISDEVFDMAADRFPEFGKNNAIKKDADGQFDLETPEMKLRSQVYADAIMFQKAKDCSFELGLRDAIQYYAGGSQQDRAVRQVVKDANDNKKRFTVRPNKRKTVKVFKSSKDKAGHIVREAKRKAGIDG
jgi:hypothetical protein